jgi:Xaa-Pro aminopeptidase
MSIALPVTPQSRLYGLRQLMQRDALTVLLISGADNRRYLSGFTGSAGVLVVTLERQAIATDFRYYTQVEQQCPDWELFRVGYDFDSRLGEVLAALGVAGDPVGFEAAHVTVERLSRWRATTPGATFVETVGLVETLRMVKDADELRAIRRAVDIADQAWEQLLADLHPGRTEREVAWQLEAAMRERGATAVAFELIVASGPNGALPHARPTDRVIRAGEPVVFDFGCVVDGYRSDITRTVCLGQPADHRYLEIWQVVQRAQAAALAGIRAGITGVAADALARDVIVAAGFGDHFGHSLGHGIGLAEHELPRLSRNYPDPLPAGAVVSVEPGVYLPGWGGVRLEDLVVVLPEGVAVLTGASREALVQ